MCFRLEKPCEPHGQQGVDTLNKKNQIFDMTIKKRPLLDYGTVGGLEPPTQPLTASSKPSELHDTPLYC